jgi:hypothetical protein
MLQEKDRGARGACLTLIVEKMDNLLSLLTQIMNIFHIVILLE